MVKIKWKSPRIPEISRNLLTQIQKQLEYIRLVFSSLTYNHHLETTPGYRSDVMMEPIFYFVDNYAHLLGPFFLVAVTCLTSAVVYICYWIGLPYWMNKSPVMTIILMIIGHWLLINVVFHYYMAAFTPVGNPPANKVFEAVGICKKCINPKPPRTHHCSVCNQCILCLDHHCPWLNNCVGYGNHRYFFSYMVYTAIGTLFIMVFGIEIGFNALLSDEGWMETEPLQGSPVKFNLTGHAIPVTEINEYSDDGIIAAEHDLPVPHEFGNNPAKHRAIIFMAFINVSVFIALGALSYWHYKLIKRGETSIEAHINRSETKRLDAMGQTFRNPYDFGPRINFRLFFGIVGGRTWWRHVLLPSTHKPVGDGLVWLTVNDTYGSTLNNDHTL